jgi:Predicted ATPase of the PP-loop superfamily implicated in cell cycle control
MLSKFQNKKILLCVSGGIDSIYMYHTLSKKFKQKLFNIGLAHVNYIHQLFQKINGTL